MVSCCGVELIDVIPLLNPADDVAVVIFAADSISGCYTDWSIAGSSLCIG